MEIESVAVAEDQGGADVAKAPELNPKHAYSWRTGKGLHVGIEGRKDLAYLVTGRGIRLVDTGDSSGPAMLTREPPWWGRPETGFMLPKVLREVLPCENMGRVTDLSPDEIAQVIASWIYVGILEKPTRPLLVFVGPPGSGKTSSARALVRLLEGSKANVMMLPKSPQDLSVVTAGHRFVAFDNVDARKGWLPDVLAAIATGALAKSRMLYTDAVIATIDIQASVMLTSMSAQFNRADIAQRSIVLEMDALDSFLPEAIMEEVVEKHRESFWACLLHDLSLLFAMEGEASGRTTFRMADFASVGSLVWGESTERILGELSNEQDAMALRDDEVLEALRESASRGALEGTAGQILDELYPDRRSAPAEAKGARAFSSYLQRIAGAAASAGLEITWTHDRSANSNRYSVRYVG